MTRKKTVYPSIIMLATFCALLVLFQASVSSKTLAEERLAFTVTAAPWTLTLPKGHFVVDEQQVKPDGRYGYFLMNDEENHMTISFFIEPVENCKDSKACRDMIWKNGNPSWENPQYVVQSEIGDVSCVEFFMPSFRGVLVKQQNMYAEFVKDGFWVDLHISKVLYEPKDHEMFVRIVKSITFEPKASPAKKQE